MMVKLCHNCLREYHRTAWRTLPFVGVQSDGQVELELRNCRCRSTISVELRWRVRELCGNEIVGEQRFGFKDEALERYGALVLSEEPPPRGKMLEERPEDGGPFAVIAMHIPAQAVAKGSVP